MDGLYESWYDQEEKDDGDDRKKIHLKDGNLFISQKKGRIIIMRKRIDTTTFFFFISPHINGRCNLY